MNVNERMGERALPSPDFMIISFICQIINI